MASAPADFQTDVLDRSQSAPVLVDFWAPWCGPCKMLGPILEKLAAEPGVAWTLVKINTDEQQDLAARFQIRGIPNLKLFHRGAVVAELAGALPEPQLRAWLAGHLPTPERSATEAAREHLVAGRAADASRLLQPLVAAHSVPPLVAALAARALVFVDPDAARTAIEALPAAAANSDDALLARAFADAFDSLAHPAGRPVPPAHRARYFAALQDLRDQRFRAAAAGLVEVLQDRPDCDGGRAKAATLALFKHLGLRHPIAEEFFRAYTMAVNI